MGNNHEDDSGENDPYAMNIIARVPKSEKPTATEFCEAVARACAAFLLDARSVEDGEWQPAVATWAAGHIRKFVRRARGPQWGALGEMPSVCVTTHGVDVRVLVPATASKTPQTVRRLQLEGLALSTNDCESLYPNTRHPVAVAGTIVVCINPEWGLDRHVGKAAAQCAHAVQIALLRMSAVDREAFVANDLPVVVLWPDAAGWETRKATAPVVITDAGFTVLPGPGDTTCATWMRDDGSAATSTILQSDHASSNASVRATTTRGLGGASLFGALRTMFATGRLFGGRA